MDCTTRRRARLSFEPLEDRAVPALLLSDVNYNVLFGSTATQQYFEVQGDPGATIPARTYLVVVDGSNGAAAGTIHSVFDLGGLKLGADGYLSVVQAGNPYTVAPGAAVLSGTTTGFGGLGGTNPDRFSDDSALSNEFQFIFGSNTFMLVSARSAPVAGADVDQNDDGLLDGAASTWTVLDSVGVLGPSLAAGANETSYGQITFSNGGLGRAPTGTTLVNTTGTGYVGRVGESTGYAAADWVAGLPLRANAASPFRLENSIFGRPSDPNHFVSGLPTGGLGAANFVSDVTGRVFADANGNGTYDAGEAGVAGQTVWADQNGDGVLNSYDTAFSIATSGLAPGADLTNAVPGATLTYVNTATSTVGRSIQVSTTTFTGDQRIGANNVGFFAGFEQLRVDFYRPASSVGIDYFNDAPLGTAAGRLEAYAADGTLLDTYVSPAVGQGAPGAPLTISRPQADIAYVIAYTDPASSNNAYFDNLRFTTPESSAVTDATGRYKVGGLIDGDYTIRSTAGGSTPVTIASLVPVHLDVPTTNGGGGGGGGGATGGTGHTLAVGGGPGSVSVFGTAGGQVSATGVLNLPVLFPDNPFDGTYRTATGDVNADGADDIVVVTGPGAPVRWAVVDGKTGTTLLVPLTTAFAGSDDFTGGGFVSVGDLNGDGRAEVVLTPDRGGGPRVTVFSVTPVGARLKANFYGIADPSFRGGARTAVGDINADGKPDLVVAAGFQGGPRVAVYNGTGVMAGTLTRLVSDFFAFDPSLRNGVYLSVGDVDGDGYGDLVIGAGLGGSPNVRVLSGKTLITGGGPVRALANPIADFFVNGDTDSRTGIRVATKDVDGDAKADVIVGSGEGQAAQIRVYAGKTVTGRTEPAPLQDLDPFGLVLTEGVFVG